jgi:hypothetical protein
MATTLTNWRKIMLHLEHLNLVVNDMPAQRNLSREVAQGEAA